MHVTYLGNSRWTAGHPRLLHRSRPLSVLPQIWLQSSWASSGGSLLGSTYSPDVLFYSTPPLNCSPSVEKSSNYIKKKKRGSCCSISHTSLEPENDFKEFQQWLLSEDDFKTLSHMSRVKNFLVKMCWTSKRNHKSLISISVTLEWPVPCLETCCSDGNPVFWVMAHMEHIKRQTDVYSSVSPLCLFPWYLPGTKSWLIQLWNGKCDIEMASVDVHLYEPASHRWFLLSRQKHQRDFYKVVSLDI